MGESVSLAPPDSRFPPPPRLFVLITMMSVVLELLQGVVWCFYYIIEATVKLVIPEKLFFKDVSGQIVLITGGGSGIGRLMCQRFARLGATIVTWDINKTGNEETVEMTKKEVGPVTILINNAGIVSGSPILDTPDARIIKTFEVNTFAHFWTIKAFLPDMLKHKQGHIVNIASLAGHAGSTKLVDYCASKFAAVGIDEAFRVELFTQGHSDYIKTTVVCPYYIPTGMFDGVNSKVIPILEPEFVADRAVAATLSNREVQLLPWWACYLLVLKNLLPSQAFLALARAFGMNVSMDEFTGRDKKST